MASCSPYQLDGGCADCRSNALITITVQQLVPLHLFPFCFILHSAVSSHLLYYLSPSAALISSIYFFPLTFPLLLRLLRSPPSTPPLFFVLLASCLAWLFHLLPFLCFSPSPLLFSSFLLCPVLSGVPS